jgi:hypothetical protein
MNILTLCQFIVTDRSKQREAQVLFITGCIFERPACRQNKEAMPIAAKQFILSIHDQVISAVVLYHVHVHFSVVVPK